MSVSNKITANAKTNKAPGKWTLLLLALVFPISTLLIWQYLGDYGLISDLLFPTPYTIGITFMNLAKSGFLWEHVSISLWRVLTGFLIGGSLGFLFGIAVGLFRRTERLLDPTIQMIRMIPSLAIVPLFVLWFGIGELSKTLIIAEATFFQLYINTFLGIRNVNNKLFEVTYVLGYSRFKQIIHLVLPAALPNILLGVRISFGISWLGLVVAELIASTSGIGYMMSDARQFADTPVVFVGIILLGILGLTADSLIRLLQQKLLRWQATINR
ncbi:ABC transporter permease [Cohnella mopanensis]|uniref:ABC transporter permease n=1 Tax=Cohnella mopanensis TaxID=2911966 RepID=UPI001EF7A968|nr:ABC transporter permease [Cohnella mopanensis]